MNEEIQPLDNIGYWFMKIVSYDFDNETVKQYYDRIMVKKELTFCEALQELYTLDNGFVPLFKTIEECEERIKVGEQSPEILKLLDEIAKKREKEND